MLRTVRRKIWGIQAKRGGLGYPPPPRGFGLRYSTVLERHFKKVLCPASMTEEAEDGLDNMSGVRTASVVNFQKTFLEEKYRSYSKAPD